MHRLAALALTLPPTLLGSYAGHQSAYELATTGATQRRAMLAETGHGYLAHAPLIALACLIVLAAGGLATVISEMRERPGTTIARWPFLLVAPSTFVVQEVLERAASGGLTWHLPVDSVFLCGLALQTPFAVLAWLLARLVVGSARTVGRRLRSAVPCVRTLSGVGRVALGSGFTAIARRSPLCDHAAERAPPSRARPALPT